MKNKLIAFAVIACIISLNSCKKGSIEVPKKIITIDVECMACAVSFNTEINPEAVLHVYKKGSYSFELESLDMINIRAYTPAVVNFSQEMKVNVKSGKEVIDTRIFSGKVISENYDVVVTKFKS